MYCKDLTISHVVLRNSPFWTVHPYDCDGVEIHNVTITSPSNSPNTDGIDPDSTINVWIHDSNINSGDDIIAIKSGIDYCGRQYGKPSANILIENCVFGYGHGISIGSEMSGGVKNVTIRNIYADGTNAGPRLKSARGRGGYLSDIVFANITLNNITVGIVIDEYYENRPPTNATGTPIIDNITFLDIKGTATTAGQFNCLPESPCTKLDLENVSIKAKNGFSCEYADGVVVNVSPTSCINTTASFYGGF
eukprot:TRINITY_DN1556_c0_g1_i6.p1 TRINITY_DN1556_c0_g1~~TRINITY_DN1556_c0_g1_i6.p1  ORF type:complete len:250 (-),score=44.70 TRINITY_DN1556_c0_g1_i6:116-865(-)